MRLAADRERGSPSLVDFSQERPSPLLPTNRGGLQTLRILYVEDHSDTRMVLARLLVRFGYNVFTAANVRDALHLLDGLAFDVLLSDIGLPDGDGFELVIEARQRQPLRYAVALTAYASDDDREHGVRAGFDRYLTKPLDVAVLRDLLSQLD